MPHSLRNLLWVIKPMASGAPKNLTSPGAARPARTLPSLVMGVKRSTWRRHDPHKEAADAAYDRVRLDALRRDAHTCQYCGFTSPGDPGAKTGSYAISGYLEVHHKDDNHRNNKVTNLVTVCPFCHQVFHVGNAGHRAAAQVVWCPWINQATVNILSNIAAISISRGGALAATGRAWFTWMSQTQSQAAQVYGDAILDVSNLGMALMDCAQRGSPGWSHRERSLAALRLIPRRDVFESAVQWWSQSAWRPDEQWESVLQEWLILCRPPQ